MKKIAFYLMGSKGLHVLKNFIIQYGSNNIEYVVSDNDKSLNESSYDQIKEITHSHKVAFFNRVQFDQSIENNFNGFKFVIGWRWLIKNSLNLIVFHDSLLPKYRGFAPLVNSLINGEPVCGVTALYANEKYDCGDIIAQKSVDIKYPIQISAAIKNIEPIYFDLVVDVYGKILSGMDLVATKQINSDATYSLWLDDEDYFIDWNWPVMKIRRFVDAVGDPYDGAKSFLNNEVVKLNNVEPIDNVFVEHRERHIGKIIFYKDNFPVVVCSDGLLQLNDIVHLNGKLVKPNFRSRFK